ncbi:hypothetical protein, partial [Sphaerospermopsis aphanizomenoides]|uniref:hypothetical protein n=1 Tax=Sphaerospermopsis aphanizomenoides TaxID=459663 RepID=UPI001D158FB4
ESGVRSQESGGDLKISLPSLEIPKNAHFFRYTLQNPCTFFLIFHLKPLIYQGFKFIQQALTNNFPEPQLQTQPG